MSNNDWKSVLKEKKYEAGYLMTEEQRNWCHGIIHTASAGAAVAGAIPIPVADAIPITAAQVTMVVGLGKVFDQKISESAAKAAIGAAASTFVGRTAIKLIPFVGWGVSAAVAAGVTEAIGWTIAVDFAKQHRNEVMKKEADAENAKYKADNERMKKNIDDEDDIDDL